MNKIETPAKYRAPALDKGLDIIELLASWPTGLTRSEIVKLMGRSQSEVYRMLERLVARDYVQRSKEGDRYSLTMKLFLLGTTHPPLRRLVSSAQPLMDQFAHENLQSIHLTVPDRGHVVVAAQASGPADWEFRLRVGAKLDLLSTSSGLVMLACQTLEERARLRTHALDMKAHSHPGDHHVQDVSDVMLDEIKLTGYRQAPSAQLVGIMDISVPVYAPDQSAVAVLTCPFIQTVDSLECEESAALMTYTRQQISALAQALSLS